MDDTQWLLAKQQGLKSSVPKLLPKTSDMTCVELKRINSNSVTKSQRVSVASILTQLKTKWDQIAELNDFISAKIETKEELEKEICSADMYQQHWKNILLSWPNFFERQSNHYTVPPTPCLH